MELLNVATPIAMLTFVISSMLGMGLGLTISEILIPLRSARVVTVGLGVNMILMPFIAITLGNLLGLEESIKVGLLILGAAAGAPFLPKLVQIAKGNLAYGVALMVLLMVATVIFLPLALPLLVEGTTVSPIAIATPLVLYMLIPLGLALATRAVAPKLAGRFKPWLDRLSSLALVSLILFLVIGQASNVLAVFGSLGILAGIIFIVAGFGLGWLFGGPGSGERKVLGIGTAQRNIAASLLVAQGFSDPQVVIMVVVVAISSLLILLPLSRYISKISGEGLKAAHSKLSTESRS